MNQLKSVSFFCLFLISWVCSNAQFTLGNATLTYARAKPLFRTEGLVRTLTSSGSAMGYLMDVGGVAFDKVASPGNVFVSSLALNYNPASADGNRFSVTINGQTAVADIYDWQLVPIAQYANSNATACFTLFGDLENSTYQQSIVSNGGRVLNYHPALTNTLLGFRLFQLDILVAEPTLSVYLPKSDNTGRYLLGNGEQAPNITNNKQGYLTYKSAFENAGGDYRSYLICDLKRDIKFGISQNSFQITGQPFYYFWQYNTDRASFRKALIDSLLIEAAHADASGQTKYTKNILLERWLLDKIQHEIYIFNPGQYSANHANFVSDKNKIKNSKSFDDYIFELFYKLMSYIIENRPKTIVYLNNMSTALSSKPQLFKNINPAVWDAGVKTMRYAAFFRYCKKYFPGEWNAFLSRIETINVQPEVKTPAILKVPKG